MVYPEVETAANVILCFIDGIYKLSIIVSSLKSLDVDVHSIINAILT